MSAILSTSNVRFVFLNKQINAAHGERVHHLVKTFAVLFCQLADLRFFSFSKQISRLD
jgi:hypothetical protein